MTQDCGNYRNMKNEVFRLYLAGYEAGRCKTLRWPSAQLVIAPGEMHRSNEEY